MTGWWNMAGAKVNECRCDDDCCYEDELGPHIIQTYDYTGHHMDLNRDVEVIVFGKEAAIPVFTCECGFRDHPANYGRHISEVAPLTVSYR